MIFRPYRLWTMAVLLSASFAARNAEAAASPSITTQPQSQTNFFGSNVVFTVAASGQTPLYYQWSLNGTNLMDDGRITGATTQTLNINSVGENDAGNYQVVVSNDHGSATSSNATLTVLVPALVTGPPLNQTILLNSNASLTASVIGTAPLSYQWYFNGAPLADGGRVSGATTTNLNISSVQTNDTGSYELVATNSYGSSTSSIATLTVVVPAMITSGQEYETVLANSNASLTVAAVGTPPLTYQWYFNGTNLIDNGRVSGSTSSNLTIANVQTNDSGWYTASVANSYGGSEGIVVLSVVFPPGITEPPTNQTVFANRDVTIAATVTGTYPLTVFWYFNGGLIGNWTTEPGPADLSLGAVQTSQAGSYQLVVTNNYGAVTSAVANLRVLVPATISNIVGGDFAFVGSNVSFTATVAGTEPLSLQWYFNGTPLADGGRVSGSTSNILSIDGVETNDGGSYQLVATNDYGSATSAVASLAIFPVITVQPSNQVARLGSNVTFTASVEPGTGPMSYQWYFYNGSFTALVDGGRVSGSTTTNLSIADVQPGDAGGYYLLVSNPYISFYSTEAGLRVLTPPSINPDVTNQIIIMGSTAVFNTGADGTPPFYFQWYFNGAAMTNGGGISGATDPTLTVYSVQTNNAGPYEVIVTNLYGAATSSVAILNVLVPARITSQPASQAILLGGNATFTVSAGGTGPLDYQWYFNGTPLVDGGRISGSTSPTVNIANVQNGDAGGYVVVVSNVFSSVRSETASLTPQAAIGPSTRYVALTSSNPSPPYLNWSNAATNIQDAIDAAVAGDTVIVSNGTYATGGRAIYGTQTNRVAIYKPLVVQSVNGPLLTSIKGTNLNSSIRGAYLTNGADLIGFTITNGGAEASGAGVWCESSSAIVSNCIIVGNGIVNFNSEGGGACGGTLIDCVLSNNSALDGGGAASNILLNCTIIGNRTYEAYPAGAVYGAGAYECNLSNCLVVGNQGNNNTYGDGAAFCTLTSCVVSNNSGFYGGGGGGVSYGIANNCIISSNLSVFGGGAYSNVLNNCILKDNLAGYGGGAYGSALDNCTVIENSISGASYNGSGIVGGSAVNSVIYYNGPYPNFYFPSNGVMNYCCTFPLPTNGIGNITTAPAFVNPAAGDWHLQSNSPCINSGKNAYVTSATDLDGNPRIVGGTVDIGAYEYQTPGSTISYAYLQQYHLPTDGSVDYADLDGTGFNVYQDWIAGLNPTNSGSVLVMQIPIVNTNSTGLTVSWLSVNNRTYYLQRATNLVMQPAFSTIQSNIAGQVGTTSFLDTTATNGAPYFYRVGVQQ